MKEKGSPISKGYLLLELMELMHSGKNSYSQYRDRNVCAHTVCLGQRVCLAWPGVCPELMNTA